MKVLIFLCLLALCEPVRAEWRIITRKPFTPRGMILPQPLPQPLPRPGQHLADPLRAQGGKFYDLRATVTNYMAWSAAFAVRSYPANSTMERDRLRTLAAFDPSTHAWGKFIVFGDVHEQRPDGLVLHTGNPGKGTQRFILLQNSPFTKSAGHVTALAIPVGHSGEMVVYDYGVSSKGPSVPAPAKSTKLVKTK
jgi:hypothetical protein